MKIVGSPISSQLKIQKVSNVKNDRCQKFWVSSLYHILGDFTEILRVIFLVGAKRCIQMLTVVKGDIRLLSRDR